VTSVAGAYQVVTKSVSRVHAFLNQSSALFDVTFCIPDFWRELPVARQVLVSRVNMIVRNDGSAVRCRHMVTPPVNRGPGIS